MYPRSHTEIDWARGVIDKPWSSTEEQKLSAVRILEKTSSGEAITLLRMLFLRAGAESAIGDLHVKYRDRSRSAAAQAARALALKSNTAGRELLIETALEESAPIVRRELAIFGLGGLQYPEIWQVLGEMLSHADPYLRRAAVAALDESFSGVKTGRYSELQISVLEELANLAFERDGDVENGDLMVDDGRQLARQLVVRYATDEMEDRLVNLLLQTADEDDGVRIVDILSHRPGQKPREALKQCLMSRNRPAQVYRAIAERFAGTADEEMKSAASRVMGESFVIRAYSRATAPSLRAASERFRAGAAILRGMRESDGPAVVQMNVQSVRRMIATAPEFSDNGEDWLTPGQATKLSSW
jgi:hypothetical protein